MLLARLREPCGNCGKNAAKKRASSSSAFWFFRANFFRLFVERCQKLLVRGKRSEGVAGVKLGHAFSDTPVNDGSGLEDYFPFFGLRFEHIADGHPADSFAHVLGDHHLIFILDGNNGHGC